MSKNRKLKWFYVAADYENVHIDENLHRHLWERRVFVFRSTQEQAERTALKIAKAQEFNYENIEGNRIQVKFREIESWGELFDNEIEHGTEVYWDWFMKANKAWQKPKATKKIATKKKTRK